MIGEGESTRKATADERKELEKAKATEMEPQMNTDEHR